MSVVELPEPPELCGIFEGKGTARMPETLPESPVAQRRGLLRRSPGPVGVDPRGGGHLRCAVDHPDPPPTGVQVAVVEPAEQDPVVGGGAAALCPFVDVVDLAPG